MMRIAILVLMALLSVNVVEAKDLYVSPTGNDSVTYAQNSATNPWRTLGRAMWGTTNRESRNGAEAAKAGDTVLVSGNQTAPGTGRRNDPAFMSENSGTATQPIVYKAVGAVRLALSSGTGPVAGAFMRNYLRFEGFTVVEDAQSQSVPDTGPVVIWDARAIELRGMTIDAGGTGHNQADNHPGIRVESAWGVIIRNSRVTNVRTAQSNAHNGACVQTYAVGALVVENNEFSNCGSGVFIKGGPARYPDTGVIIRNNLIRNIVGGSGITFHAGAIGTAANPIVVENNIVKDSDVPAVRIWGFGADPLNTPMNVRVRNNTFYNVRSGLLLNGAVPLANAGHRYERNIVVATYLPVEWDSPTMQSASAIRLDANVSPSVNWATVTSGSTYSLSAWRTASGQDTTSIQAQPLFVSASDLRLQAGSPAQGAGAYVTGNEQIGVIDGVVAPPPPPTPVNCVVSPFTLQSAGEWTTCAAGTQTRDEVWSRIVMTPPANGGLACPALSETRVGTQNCVMPPPPPPPPPPAPSVEVLCTIVSQGTNYANGDERFTLRCPPSDINVVGVTVRRPQ